ncbi:unnamed protein product, partial [Ilex paraguariensis]
IADEEKMSFVKKRIDMSHENQIVHVHELKKYHEKVMNAEHSESCYCCNDCGNHDHDHDHDHHHHEKRPESLVMVERGQIDDPST